MPADYSSTARALALPPSPLNSPSPDPNGRPPWVRTLSASSRRVNRFADANEHLTYGDQALAAITKVYNKVMATFRRMSPIQRALAVAAFAILNVLGVLFLIYNERIFGWLAPGAKRWRGVRGGWVLLWALTFISAMPPLIGYSTTVTIAGFVYGFPYGWYIVASSTVIGSLASFLASRTVLSQYVHRLVGNDKRFEALALTLEHDGLKILCMIRFCPLPYSLSNAAMSTFPTVRPLMYALATAISTPKLMIHVFIGSRLAKIAETGGKMDASTKAVNYASIIGGAVLGASVGWIIYQRTIARARELEIEERERLEAEGVHIYSDDGRPDEMMNEDDISLWDNNEQAYRDDFTDDDENPFAKDDDEEANIGSNSGAKKTEDVDP